MEIRPIRTETDYEAALDAISELMQDDPMPGTPDGDRLDVLTTLVQAYEAQQHPVLPPDPDTYRRCLRVVDRFRAIGARER